MQLNYNLFVRTKPIQNHQKRQKKFSSNKSCITRGSREFFFKLNQLSNLFYNNIFHGFWFRTFSKIQPLKFLDMCRIDPYKYLNNYIDD